MASTLDAPRRGRKEGLLDPTSPPHRRAFAERLRALRNDCHDPAYRLLSKLSHCGSGTLSEAAGGRRFPTWEATRAYVTGCLLYARRDREIDEILPVWRHLWIEANALEQAYRQQEARQRRSTTPGAYSPKSTAAPEPKSSETAGSAPGPPADDLIGRRSPRSLALTAAVVIALVLSLLGASIPASQPHMTGLYNIVLAPFSWSGQTREAQVASRLQAVLFRELKAWSDGVAAIQLRGPDQVEVIEAEAGPGRGRAMQRVARDHGADVVVTGRLHFTDGRMTVALELFLTDRTFGVAPEFVGLHDISITEPADVFTRNLEINEELTEAALHYLKGVVAFVRGLGAYALEDFADAEAGLLTAEAEFDLVEEATGHREVRRGVLYLLLGNTIGRDDKGRLGQAADYYQLALSQDPLYTRARIGLAEATRAAAGCRPGQTRAADLNLAIEHYSAALTGDDGEQESQAFLQMQVRLGLGLTYQCLTIAKLGNRLGDADREFREALGVHTAIQTAGGGTRHGLRLAAEAKAGQALTAFLTANQPDATRYGGYPAAAAAYEEALRILGQIDVERPTTLERELIYLRNLRSVYQAMGAPAAKDVEARISATDSRLAAIAETR